MAALRQLTWIVGACLLAAPGCALWAPAATPQAKAPLTRDQAEWWAANQHRKRFVAGRGYYIEGVNGFFDHEGHKLATDMSASVSATSEDTGILAKLSPKHSIAAMKKAVGRGPNETVARAALAEGDTLFRQKEYKQAAAKYRTAYGRWPDSPLEEEALYKAAESEFFADRYSKADDEYALLIKKFPSTQYLSQVMIRRFAIGHYWEQYDLAHPHWPTTPNLVDKTRPRFDTGGHAIRVFERIRLDDPTGSLSDDAVMHTANANFVRGRWEEADYHYGLLRSEYPKSEHQFQAHLLGLRCKLLQYQGPGYEGSPLDDAEDLATQLLTQFSQELGEERERVAQVRAGVRSQRALREWDTAEFYAKGKYYGAARIYYAKVVNDYPETQLAEQARGRVEEFKDLPSTPTPPFEWLVNMMPQSKREGPVIPKNLAPATSDSSVTPVASQPSGTTQR